MSKYHYEIIVDLTTLKPSEHSTDQKQLARHMFGKTDEINLYFDTNNRLVKDELLTIHSNNCLINLEITKITRYQANLVDYDLIDMDMTNSWYQENRPKNTTDEMWFVCKANGLVLEG